MKGRFVDLTDDEEKRLFNSEFRGPLSEFSARIKVGFAMYLFGRETRDDLEIIRRIRNLFAHQSTVLTFATEL
jgi:DNA-binding MltR family transcriptional regulator